MSSWVNILAGAVLLAAGAVLAYVGLWLKGRGMRKARDLEAEAILTKARNEAEIIVRDELERRLSQREGLINSQRERIVEAEKSLTEQKVAFRQRTEAVEKVERALEELTRQNREALQRAAGLTREEAKAEFLKRIEQEALRDASNLSRHILDEAKTKAEEKARRIISVAIQRYAGEHTFENTTATIALQGDEIKGRIIGREGRNIRAFEAATGVTVLIDDTPGAVLLSGFDPVRREVAREAMQRLTLHGRIHPSRIEEVVAKV